MQRPLVTTWNTATYPMELTPTQLKTTQTITLTTGKSAPTKLTVGQQITASVVSTNKSTGTITLNIQNAQIKATSNLPLVVGQSLKLTVIQADTKVVLQTSQASVDKAVTQQTLRESLPKQQALDETLKNIERVVKEGKEAGVSDKVIQLAQRFLQQLPNSKQLTQAESLKEIIQKSGIFLENKLANLTNATSQQNISTDFKAFLLQLKSLLLKEQNQQVNQNRAANTEKLITEKQVQHNTEEKILDIAKQIKTSSEGKQLTEQQQLKQALQQTLLKINQQQKTISQNLARLLNSNATTNITLPRIQVGKTNLLNPAIIKQHAPQPSLKDALSFTNGTQRNTKPEISFSRLGNLTDLLDTLIKQVDAGISRTQLHQLNNLLDQETGKMNWSMEIPVKVDEKLYSIHLHLEKDQTKADDAEPVLTVNIALDLENLGPIYARITLISDNVGIALWAERKETYELTQDHIDNLETNLSHSGLKPNNLHCHHGQPPKNQTLHVTENSSLLDIKV